MSQHSPNWMVSKWLTGVFVNAELNGHAELGSPVDPDISPSPQIRLGSFTRIHQDHPEKNGAPEHHFRHHQSYDFSCGHEFFLTENPYDCEEISMKKPFVTPFKTSPQGEFSCKLWGPRCHKWWLGLRKSSPNMELTYLRCLIQEGLFKTFFAGITFFSIGKHHYKAIKAMGFL